jgi:hypothetical protein
MTSQGFWYWIQPAPRPARGRASGLKAGAMAAALVLMAFNAGCDNRQAQAVAVQERAFDAADFQWPEFIQALYTADLENARTQSVDQVFLMVQYVKFMNETFGDPTMSAFFGDSPACFTRLYEPRLNAMLDAMLWGEQLPRIFLEIMALLADPKANGGAEFEAKFPFLASIIGNLREQLPRGRLEQLAAARRLWEIFQDRARKDALMLFTEYGCASPVTQAVYQNAVRFVEMEPLKVPKRG